jgi:Predicted membrane protein (DUF2306)
MIVLVFAGMRVATDWPNVAAGTIPPDESPDYSYALHPVLAYAHILPGVIYLLGAPFQLSRRFRERHFTVHRRMGRVVLPAGIRAGVFAIVFGLVSRSAASRRRSPPSSLAATSSRHWSLRSWQSSAATSPVTAGG